MRDKLIVLGTGILLFALIGAYLYFGAVTVEVSYYKITDEMIPQEFNNYKILQISDYHNEKNIKINNSIIKKIKKEKPDLIVITGDLVDAGSTDIDFAIEFITKIKDMAPIYYVSGNHEANIREYVKLKEQLINHGVHILDNKVEEIAINDVKINILGIDDPNMNKDLINDKEKITAYLNKIDYDKDNYTILLSHRPELFDTYVAKKINLVFTGHAHGGGIRIPIIGGVIAPNQGLFPKYDCGLYKDDGTVMIVSRGIGNSILPLRINNKPELTVTTLRHKKLK